MENGVKLPRGVEVVRAKGRTYYYWNPGRGTSRQGERVKLPDAEANPRAFWTEVERRQTTAPTAYPHGSIGDLVERWRESEDFKKLSDSTQSSYGVSLNRFKAPEGWGFLPARQLTPVAVMAARDAAKETPSQANHMLACGRSLWNWAIPLGLVETNPFDKIPDLELPDRGHVPWPAWTIEFVLGACATEWPDIVRMVRLGVMTCQRESDFIRMGPEHRDRNGIWCRPKKTRKRRRSFHIPLNPADAAELDRWAITPMSFKASRWKKPIERFRDDRYLYSPKGAPYSPDSLRARWGRLLTRTKEGRDLCQRWQRWIADQARRYDWDITPEDAANPTIHGLRGTGILARAEVGYDVDQIANDIGMSRQMVEHYMRFRDQMKVGADGQRRLRIVGKD